MILAIFVDKLQAINMQNSMSNTLKRLLTGIQTCEKIIEGDYLYIDKTALI